MIGNAVEAKQVDQYSIDKARVRASFDRAANTYDAAAVLQKLVRDEMLSRLDFVKINIPAFINMNNEKKAFTTSSI